MPSNLKSKE
jgi:tubulin--tyrosine ligase